MAKMYSAIGDVHCVRCGVLFTPAPSRSINGHAKYCSLGCRREPLELRLARYTDKSGPVPQHVAGLGPCWLWTGHRDIHGYATLTIRTDGKARPVKVTRLMFQLAHGRWPLRALHRCDNPACVNPQHIFEGSPQDNSTDMARKGRARNVPMPGQRNPSAKITDAAALEIRKRLGAGQKPMQISRDLAVPWRVVCRIAYEKTKWKHVKEGGVPL
jgi:hypothetical protein